MSKKTDIVLSASAMAAALGALSQVAQTSNADGVPYRITVTSVDDQDVYGDTIAAAMTHTAVQAALRQSMSTLLPAMDVDQDRLEEAWIRLANAGTGNMMGPNQDSTLNDPRNQTGISNCYTNCHSACHGSRGWR